MAVIMAVVIAACGGSSNGGGSTNANKAAKSYGTVLAGTLPTAGTPRNGGTITAGEITGQTPLDIFPLVDGNTCGTPTFEFVASQYIPLYGGPTGAEPKIDPSQSAAEMPTYSDGDKTVTIKLKPGLKWSDGKPVDANDVIFYLDLLKAAVKESPANWCQYSPGDMPANVASWNTEGADTVVLHLKQSVNPQWFTNNQLQDAGGGVYPIPSQAWNVASAGGPHLDYTNPANAKKIYDYLHKAGESVATFASNPLWQVVDGPFRLKDFSATNSSYDLVPNKSYGLTPKARFDDWSMQTYTSTAAMLNALESGSVEIASLDPSQIGAIPTLKKDGVSVFGGPLWGWFGGIINFKDTTDHFNKIIVQPYIREALGELMNQPAILKGVYKGWAVPAYGPVATAPDSSYAPADATKAPYPYNPTAAAKLLKAHGWKVVPNGQTTCQRAGTGANECGAGIPAGTPFKFVWANQPQAAAPDAVLESEAFASEAKQAAGVNIDLVSKSFNFLTANYNNMNPAAAKYVNDWGVNNYGGVGSNYYPTQEGALNAGGGLNLGAFDDPTANKLMAASVSSASTKAISDEVAYLTKNYPVFFMPVQDWITGVSSKVGGSENAFLTMTQQLYVPQFLYLKKG